MGELQTNCSSLEHLQMRTSVVLGKGIQINLPKVQRSAFVLEGSSRISFPMLLEGKSMGIGLEPLSRTNLPSSVISMLMTVLQTQVRLAIVLGGMSQIGRPSFVVISTLVHQINFRKMLEVPPVIGLGLSLIQITLNLRKSPMQKKLPLAFGMQKLLSQIIHPLQEKPQTLAMGQHQIDLLSVAISMLQELQMQARSGIAIRTVRNRTSC